MVTRREVSIILHNCGMKNKFTLRTVGFSDLARADVQVVELLDVKEWNPGIGEAKSRLKAIGVILKDVIIYKE